MCASSSAIWHEGLGRLTRARVSGPTDGNNQAVERAAAVLTPAVAVDRGAATGRRTTTPVRSAIHRAALSVTRCPAMPGDFLSSRTTAAKGRFAARNFDHWRTRARGPRTVVHRNRKFADLYGGFSVKWFFGLLPVPCLERKGRSSSRRLRSGSRSARKGVKGPKC